MSNVSHSMEAHAMVPEYDRRSAHVLVLTDESLTQSTAIAARAVELFGGAFGEVARFYHEVERRGYAAKLHVATRVRGMISGSTILEPYGEADGSSDQLLGAAAEMRAEIDGTTGVVLLAMQRRLVERLIGGYRSSFDGTLYAVTSTELDARLRQAFPRAEVVVFERRGVARIGSTVSGRILASLAPSGQPRDDAHEWRGRP